MSWSTQSSKRVSGFDPAYMLDQSHNVTDPIESLISSAVELVRAYVQAHLVDRDALAEYQQTNDPLMALQTLKQAFTTDVDADSCHGSRPRWRRDRSDRRLPVERLSPEESVSSGLRRRALARGSSDDSQSLPHVGATRGRRRSTSGGTIRSGRSLPTRSPSHGVTSYSIFIDPITRDLFAYAEIESEERWQAIAGTDVCRRWWAHMREIMPSNPDNSPVIPRAA